MRDLQELWILLIAPASFFGFVFICKKVRYGTLRSVCVLLWGLMHLIPTLGFITFTATGIDTLKQPIGGLSFLYLLMTGTVFSVIAFVREPGRQGEYFADGPSWPT